MSEGEAENDNGSNKRQQEGKVGKQKGGRKTRINRKQTSFIQGIGKKKKKANANLEKANNKDI